MLNLGKPNLLEHSHAGAHRALADVQAMKAVFAHLSLSHCLAKLEPRSPSQQLNSWYKQKGVHHRTTSLISALGKPSITAPQAKRLDQLGLTLSKLRRIHSEAKDTESFKMTLKSKGVNSKPLQAKLAKLLGGP